MSSLIKETVVLGKAKYIQGDFESAKNKMKFPYRSSYELAYLHQLESDDQVVQYIYEPFEVPYTDIDNRKRMYRPDFMILYADGSMKISEVKPSIMLKDYDVQSKARHCREFIKTTFIDVNIEYTFITEKDLFSSEKEYADFLKCIK